MWETLLDKAVRRIFRTGTFILEMPDGSRTRYGDGTGTPVTVRLKNRDLVRRILQLSWSYEDVTLASYGEMLSVDEMDDDEGGAMDFYADEHLYTFDLCLSLLSEEAAAARDDWSALVEEVCEKKREQISYMSFGDAEVKALFAKSWVMDHPARDRLKPVARKAFPYAGLD